MSEETKQLKVSNEFVDIFKNFNVINKVEEIKALSKKELYLLLTLCLDKHDDGQPFFLISVVVGICEFLFVPFKK